MAYVKEVWFQLQNRVWIKIAFFKKKIFLGGGYWNDAKTARKSFAVNMNVIISFCNLK